MRGRGKRETGTQEEGETAVPTAVLISCLLPTQWFFPSERLPIDRIFKNFRNEEDIDEEEEGESIYVGRRQEPARKRERERRRGVARGAAREREKRGHRWEEGVVADRARERGWGLTTTTPQRRGFLFVSPREFLFVSFSRYPDPTHPPSESFDFSARLRHPFARPLALFSPSPSHILSSLPPLLPPSLPLPLST